MAALGANPYCDRHEIGTSDVRRPDHPPPRRAAVFRLAREVVGASRGPLARMTDAEQFPAANGGGAPELHPRYLAVDLSASTPMLVIGGGRQIKSSPRYKSIRLPATTFLALADPRRFWSKSVSNPGHPLKTSPTWRQIPHPRQGDLRPAI